MPEMRDDTGREKVRTAIINFLALAMAQVANVPASTDAQMISPELLARITTNTPLELKATAVDGSQIDLEKLRGKVVLLDFWATWCGPCVQEAPKVVATYNKLHDKGFEIIGISLDQNKESVSRFTKKLGMTWPQYFDGDKQVSSRFGIEAIPTMWLIDKEGHIASVEARDDLSGKAEKLLAK